MKTINVGILRVLFLIIISIIISINILMSQTSYIAKDIYPSKAILGTVKTSSYNDSINDKFEINEQIIFNSKGTCEANFTYIDTTSGILFRDSTVTTDTINNYYWDFGDGQFNSYFPQVIHSYADTGTYNVCLKITTTAACSDSICKEVKVSVVYYSLSGTVNVGDTQMCNGTVILFRNDNNYWKPVKYYNLTDVDCENETTSGYNYKFNNIEAGNYIIYAIPNISYYPYYLPTYYDNEFLWRNAHILNINANTYDVDIHLYKIIFDSAFFTGNGRITGNINSEDDSLYESNVYSNILKNDSSKDSKSMSIWKMPIILFTTSGIPITWTLSDSNGDYEFNNLPYGNYEIRYEKAGFEQLNSPIISLNSVTPVISNVQITINANEITLSIPKEKGNMELIDVRNIYPNPVRDNLNITLNIKDKTNIQISIFNVTGQIIYTDNLSDVDKNRILKINTSNLSEGLYFGKISTDRNELIHFKFIKQE